MSFFGCREDGDEHHEGCDSRGNNSMHTHRRSPCNRGEPKSCIALEIIACTCPGREGFQNPACFRGAILLIIVAGLRLVRRTTGMLDIKDEVKAAVEAVSPVLADSRPRAAIITGSGLGGVIARGTLRASMKFEGVPGLPAPAVPGHGSTIGVIELNGKAFLFFGGRAHLYEGHSPASLGMAVRIAAALGVRTLVSACAVGALRPEFNLFARVEHGGSPAGGRTGNRGLNRRLRLGKRSVVRNSRGGANARDSRRRRRWYVASS